jgi:hypothetical protein
MKHRDRSHNDLARTPVFAFKVIAVLLGIIVAETIGLTLLATVSNVVNRYKNNAKGDDGTDR